MQLGLVFVLFFLCQPITFCSFLATIKTRFTRQLFYPVTLFELMGRYKPNIYKMKFKIKTELSGVYTCIVLLLLLISILINK